MGEQVAGMETMGISSGVRAVVANPGTSDIPRPVMLAGSDADRGGVATMMIDREPVAPWFTG